MRVSANFLLGALVSSACLPGAEIAAEGAAEPVPGGACTPGPDRAEIRPRRRRTAGAGGGSRCRLVPQARTRRLGLSGGLRGDRRSQPGRTRCAERRRLAAGGRRRHQFNDFRGDVGAGISAAGLVPGRPDDQLAFAVASVQGGAPWRDAQALAGAPVDPRETTVELTWRMPVNDWLTLQPDFQCVINPGLSAELDHAVVADLRFEFGTSWAR